MFKIPFLRIKNNYQTIDSDNVKGFIFGFYIGESLGVQVIDKNPEHLKKYPVIDFIGFSDFKNRAGSDLIFFNDFLSVIKRQINLLENKANKLINFLVLTENNKLEINIESVFNVLSIVLFFNKLQSRDLGSLKKYFTETNDCLTSILFLVILVFQIRIAPNSNIALKNSIKLIQFVNKNWTSISKNNLHKIYKNGQLISEQLFISQNIQYFNISIIIANSLINHNDYNEAVLYSINQGFCSNITGAICSSLSGFVNGYNTIPKEWINQLIEKDNILNISDEINSFVKNIFPNTYL